MPKSSLQQERSLSDSSQSQESYSQKIQPKKQEQICKKEEEQHEEHLLNQEDSQNQQNNQNNSKIEEKEKPLEENSKQALNRIKNIYGVSIFCGICQDYIAHTVTTFCQHSFCQLCLTEYFLYLDQCPECSLRIRHQRVSSNILLDNIILDYLRKFEPDQLDGFNQRLQQLKQYQKDRRIVDFDAGTQVDIRDSDYIWCTGRIVRTINKIQDKKIKCMIIKYDKSSKKQQIPQYSPRIAPYGFYSKRTDIPKYHRGKLILENKEDNIIYTVPNFYDQQEQKQNS